MPREVLWVWAKDINFRMKIEASTSSLFKPFTASLKGKKKRCWFCLFQSLTLLGQKHFCSVSFLSPPPFSWKKWSFNHHLSGCNSCFPVQEISSSMAWHNIHVFFIWKPMLRGDQCWLDRLNLYTVTCQAGAKHLCVFLPSFLSFFPSPVCSPGANHLIGFHLCGLLMPFIGSLRVKAGQTSFGALNKETCLKRSLFVWSAKTPLKGDVTCSRWLFIFIIAIVFSLTACLEASLWFDCSCAIKARVNKLNKKSIPFTLKLTLNISRSKFNRVKLYAETNDVGIYSRRQGTNASCHLTSLKWMGCASTHKGNSILLLCALAALSALVCD